MRFGIGTEDKEDIVLFHLEKLKNDIHITANCQLIAWFDPCSKKMVVDERYLRGVGLELEVRR